MSKGWPPIEPGFFWRVANSLSRKAYCVSISIGDWRKQSARTLFLPRNKEQLTPSLQLRGPRHPTRDRQEEGHGRRRWKVRVAPPSDIRSRWARSTGEAVAWPGSPRPARRAMRRRTRWRGPEGRRGECRSPATDGGHRRSLVPPPASSDRRPTGRRTTRGRRASPKSAATG